MSDNKTSPHRGGTVVMVKNYLAQSAMNVDTSTADQSYLHEQSCLTNTDLTDIDLTDVDVLASNVANMLYECSEASQVPVAVANLVSGGNRWDRLLSDPDDTRVWKAIPSDEFKSYYETFCNPGIDDDFNYSNDSPYVPILDDVITVDELSSTSDSENET
ncbi:hypothetical protein E2C01_096830 [Portunus trituberculatus]|uniref:Uncharacterized protein n=1 Tax=Portunus trituberculatus TaxID=210409 RepID=A0A5B7K2T0_PORTR|nr:hypothetical protein [Portunus trituberculatus]